MKSGRYEVILMLHVYLLPDKLYNCKGTIFIIDYIIAQINDMLYIHINKIIFAYNIISRFIVSINCTQNMKATQVMLFYAIHYLYAIHYFSNNAIHCITLYNTLYNCNNALYNNTL